VAPRSFLGAQASRQIGVKPTAKLYGTSPQTVRKWVRRYQADRRRGDAVDQSIACTSSVLMPNAFPASRIVSQHFPQSQDTGSPWDAISLLTVIFKAS